MFKNIESFLEENSCNIGFKKGLEATSCVGTTLARIIITLFLYTNNIVLMAMCPSNLEKQLRILKYFCSNMGMLVNIDKTKVTTCTNFVYDNNNLEEVTSYKHLWIQPSSHA
jgi:hypothetical protein